MAEPKDFDGEEEELKVDPKDAGKDTRPDSDIFEDDIAPDHGEEDLRDIDPDAPGKRVRGDGPVEDDEDAADGEDGEQDVNLRGRLPDQDEDGKFIDRETGRPYGEKVQRRIAKESSRRQAAETRADRLERELAEERAKGRDREFKESEGAVTHFGNEITRLTAEQTKIKADLKKAKEKGDTEDEVELIARLNQTQINLTNADYGKKQAEARFTTVKADRERGGDRTDSRERPRVLPSTQSWMERNASWFNNRDYAAETLGARGIEQALAQEVQDGKFAHGPETAQYWREVDRRTKAIYPRTPIAGTRSESRDDRRPDRTRRRAASPVGGSRGAPPMEQRSSGNKVTLTEADLATMRSFKMDPNNPAERKAYADTKRALDAQEAKEGE